jgi:GGDEF domain-containing protein
MEHFAALLNRQLGYCRRSGSRMALLLVHAEPVAESAELLPSPRQPELLWQLVGARLVNRVRGTDVVYRIGDARFAVVLMGAGRYEAEIARARLLKVLAGPYGIEQRTIGLALQVGMGVFRECGDTGTELTAAADRALRVQRSADRTVVRDGEGG